MLNEILKLNLHLFDGDGESSANASGAVAEQGTADNKEIDSRIPWDLLDEEDRPENQEIHEEEQQETQPNQDEVKKGKVSFDDLINGEYREDYQNKMTAAIKDRVKTINAKNAAAQKQIDSTKPIIDMLAARYNKKSDDLEGIKQSLESAYFNQRAIDNGTSEDEERKAYNEAEQNKQMQAELERLRQAEADRQTYFALQQQSEVLKNKYPDFDLSQECQNEKFTQALALTKALSPSGVENVEMAYEITHLDKLRDTAIATTAQQTARAMTNNIIAQNYLPNENGNSSNYGNSPQAKSIEQMSDDEIQKLVDNQRERGIPISKFLK